MKTNFSRRMVSAVLLAVAMLGDGAVAVAAAPKEQQQKKGIVPVSQAYFDCYQLAKQVPSEFESSYSVNDGMQLSEGDSALVGCFIKFSAIDQFSYPNCFEVAATLPTPYSRGIAATVCFNQWANLGTTENCHWAASQVAQYLHVPTDNGIRSAIAKYAPSDRAGDFPQLVSSPASMHATCERFKEEKRVAAALELRNTLARKIQNLESEKAPASAELCATEASLLASNYAIFRAMREKEFAPLVNDLRKILNGIPQKVRDAIAIGKPEEAVFLLENYRKRLPTSVILTLDSSRMEIQLLTSPQIPSAANKNVAIRATEIEQEEEIEAKVTSPVAMGWPEYFKQNASEGCKFVPLKRTPRQAVAGGQVKRSREEYEKSLESCDPIAKDCGFNSAGAPQ